MTNYNNSYLFMILKLINLNHILIKKFLIVMVEILKMVYLLFYGNITVERINNF